MDMSTTDRDSLAGAILARCDERPERVCLTFIGGDGQATEVTGGDLARRIAGYAHALDRRGVEPGDVVLLALDQDIDLVALFLGAIAIGAQPCLFPSFTPKLDSEAYTRRLAGVASRLEPRLVLVPSAARLNDPGAPARGIDLATLSVDATAADGSDRLPLRHQDGAFLQLSSGSTGTQKAIGVSHRAVFNLVRARDDAFAMTPGDVVVGWVPFYHDLGLIGSLLAPLLTGVPSVAISTFYWLLHPVALMQVIHRYRGTICAMPNFAFNYCAARVQDADMQGIDLAHWRILYNSAEPIRPGAFTAFAKRFEPWGFRSSAFTTGYGLAENTLTVTAAALGRAPRVDWIDRTALQDRRSAECRSEAAGGTPIVSCGMPLSNVALQIRSATDAVLADRAVGEVVVKSDCLFDGYFRNPEATADALRDGWLYTGDLGYIADGELFICGRKKDLIIVGGTNVHAEDIELTIAGIEGLRSGRVVAFGVPDDERGSEKIIVLGELRTETGRDPSEIESDVRRRIKRELDVAIAQMAFVPPGWIAKTTSGKVARWANRAKWLAQ
jgi:acyl-CoA synthetase (AMP-forming)/AMP-acid ligase II